MRSCFEADGEYKAAEAEVAKASCSGSKHTSFRQHQYATFEQIVSMVRACLSQRSSKRLQMEPATCRLALIDSTVRFLPVRFLPVVSVLIAESFRPRPSQPSLVESSGDHPGDSDVARIAARLVNIEGLPTH